MSKTILETKNKLSKVKEIIDQNEKKFGPMLQKMDNQLEILKKEKERLSSDSTKLGKCKIFKKARLALKYLATRRP